MKKLALMMLIIWIISYQVLLSQGGPQLSSNDIERVLRILPQLAKFFNEHKFEEKFDFDSDDPSQIIEVIKATKEMKSFFPREGMSMEEFFQKWSLIMKIYSHLKLKEVARETNDPFQKSLNAIKDNPYISEEQKNKMIEQMKANMQSLQKTQEENEKELHPQDIALVKKYMEKIEKTFDLLDEINNDDKEE